MVARRAINCSPNEEEEGEGGERAEESDRCGCACARRAVKESRRRFYDLFDSRRAGFDDYHTRESLVISCVHPCSVCSSRVASRLRIRTRVTRVCKRVAKAREKVKSVFDEFITRR